MAEHSASSVNSIFLGEVASVQSYGAFVKIPGCSSQGLVHRSQISKVNVPDVSEVLSKGDRVWCKVINNADDGKIGLSMKVIDQGNGKDLDPNGVQIKLDEQRRKEWTPGEKRKAISLEAVFNTTCSKCGTRGHLSKDCFQVAGGKTYELIPEDNLETKHPSANSDTVAPYEIQEKERKRDEKEAKRQRKEVKRKKKAAKKLKKKLKKEAKKAKKQREKKEKSKKKKEHSSSDDSSDTSDTSSESSSESDNERNSSHSKRTLKRELKSNSPRCETRRSRSRSSSRETKRSRRDSEDQRTSAPSQILRGDRGDKKSRR